jgi:hypothetical protein
VPGADAAPPRDQEADDPAAVPAVADVRDDEEVRENKRRLAAAQNDDRDLLWACKRHHDLHEKAKRIPVPREELPEAVELFAADYGLAYELERQFGPLEGGEGL